MIPRLLKFLQRLYTRLWLKLHWRRSIDSAPEKYVEALEDVNADWEVTKRLMRR